MKKVAKTGQMKAPISEAMEAYAGDGALAFHTPGHKQGLGAHKKLKKLITKEGLKREVSLMEELDDLHAPFGCIQEAETLAAELWGAKETLFQINGTTGAIHAMLLGTLNPGDKVLVPRNAHRSIVGGIILAGARPVFLQPEIHPKLGIPMGISTETIMRCLMVHRNAKALVMVYPTYYGIASDLKEIAELVHNKNMLLLVDEAHGAHLRFSDKLPMQALDCGADVVAQSTHKLLGSMTQTSMLHIGSTRVSAERIRRAAALLQSTSPNQLLLASLDIARLQMAEIGNNWINQTVELAQWVRNRINSIEGLYCVGDEILGGSGAYKLDYTKITVNLEGIGMSGPFVEKLLREKYKIQCELSDPRNILFIISYADSDAECMRLVQALKDVAEKEFLWDAGAEELFTTEIEPLKTPRAIVDPRTAFFSESEPIPFEMAAGRASAESVVFYPPGVPVLCAGEEITEELIEFVRKRQHIGLRVVGPVDTELNYIMVIKNDEVLF